MAYVWNKKPEDSNMNDNPMIVYSRLHYQLNIIRTRAAQSEIMGPKVYIYN
jgi:hypothetical protein